MALMISLQLVQDDLYDRPDDSHRRLDEALQLASATMDRLRALARNLKQSLEQPLATGIRVVLADDHHLVRQGIRSLLEKTRDIQIVGEASNGEEALQLVQKLQPDVIILDIAMPLLNGIQVTEQIEALRLPTRVVILSMYDDETLVRRAIRHGAIGYLLKRSVSEELHLAVRARQS